MKQLFNVKYCNKFIEAFIFLLALILGLSIYIANWHIDYNIRLDEEDMHENEELYAVDSYKEYLHKRHKKLSLRGALTEVSPKPNYHSSNVRNVLNMLIIHNGSENPNDFSKLEMDDQDQIYRFKRDKPKNVLDTFDLITFFFLLIIIMFISLIFTKNRTDAEMNDLIYYRSYDDIKNKEKIRCYLKYVVGKYSINMILYHYVLLVLPLLIAITGGGLNSLNDNIIDARLLEFIGYSACLFSIVQFIRIYRNYVYDVISNKMVVNLNDRNIIDSIHHYIYKN